jgi:hypothetical protein
VVKELLEFIQRRNGWKVAKPVRMFDDPISLLYKAGDFLNLQGISPRGRNTERPGALSISYGRFQKAIAD